MSNFGGQGIKRCTESLVDPTGLMTKIGIRDYISSLYRQISVRNHAPAVEKPPSYMHKTSQSKMNRS